MSQFHKKGLHYRSMCVVYCSLAAVSYLEVPTGKSLGHACTCSCLFYLNIIKFKLFSSITDL